MDGMIGRLVIEGLSPLLGAGLTVGGYAYAAQWPASRIFGRAVIAPRSPEELAITFDDGPNREWSPQILALLARYQVKATFFMVGKRAAEEPELVRAVHAAGHLVGCHSWEHPNLAYVGLERVEQELWRSRRAIEEITGEALRYFRPPFGAHGPLTFRQARRMGLEPVLWNAMTSDWKEPDAERIAERLGRRIDALAAGGRAANVVLHDGNHLDPEANRAPSTRALELLLEKYKGRKKFVRIDAWG